MQCHQIRGNQIKLTDNDVILKLSISLRNYEKIKEFWLLAFQTIILFLFQCLTVIKFRS
jgi:hypothetical protein